MEETTFGFGRGRIPAAVARRIDAIARQHGATFTAFRRPGDGWIYWFSAPNRGAPHDQHLAAAVDEALTEAGLQPEDHLIDEDAA